MLRVKKKNKAIDSGRGKRIQEKARGEGRKKSLEKSKGRRSPDQKKRWIHARRKAWFLGCRKRKAIGVTRQPLKNTEWTGGQG